MSNVTVRGAVMMLPQGHRGIDRIGHRGGSPVGGGSPIAIGVQVPSLRRRRRGPANADDRQCDDPPAVRPRPATSTRSRPMKDGNRAAAHFGVARRDDYRWRRPIRGIARIRSFCEGGRKPARPSLKRRDECKSLGVLVRFGCAQPTPRRSSLIKLPCHAICSKPSPVRKPVLSIFLGSYG
jgi:hypothetical protein